MYHDNDLAIPYKSANFLCELLIVLVHSSKERLIKMEKFLNKKYKLDRCENMDEMLKEMGEKLECFANLQKPSA